MRGDWAGIPLPLDDQRLVIEPTYPMADTLMAMGSGMTREQIEVENDGWKQRNQWYSARHRCDIILMEKDGRIDWGRLPAFHHISHDMQTLGCADAWGLEQEWAAMDTLSSMISGRAMKQYILTGVFLERSARSGVMYMFRRLKPTVALSMRGEHPKILAALCMHPIAYYAGSWAGAMCPTDDVIAHLTMMRGDEHMFWKRCNQHPAYRPEAGL